MKINEEEMLELIRLYKTDMPKKEIAAKYGVTVRTIENRIVKYYETHPQKKRYKRPKGQRSILPMDEVIEIYESRSTTIKELAKKYGVSEKVINSRIRKYYIRAQKERPIRTNRLADGITVEEMVRFFENNPDIRVEDMAKKFGISPRVFDEKITNWYISHGLERPKRERQKQYRPTNEMIIQELIKLQQRIKATDEQIIQMAKVYGIPETDMRVALDNSRSER